MYKKTFETIKKNPKILFWFIFVIVIPLLGNMPNYFTNLRNTLDIQAFSQGSYDSHLTSIILTSTFVMLIALLNGIFVFPQVYNYVYEVCDNKLLDGWYKRGLKKNWWKIVILYLLMFITMFIVMLPSFLLFALGGFAVAFGVLLLFILCFTLSIYSQIATVAVIVEDDFWQGIKNTFAYGSNYFWRLFGTMMIIAITSYILSTICNFAAGDMILYNTYTPSFIVISSIYYIVLYAWMIFGTAFLYTYNMKNYLEQRGPVFVPATQQEVEELSAVGE